MSGGEKKQTPQRDLSIEIVEELKVLYVHSVLGHGTIRFKLGNDQAKRAIDGLFFSLRINEKLFHNNIDDRDINVTVHMVCNTAKVAANRIGKKGRIVEKGGLFVV